MSTTEAPSLPQITFAPELVIPYDVKSELQASLTYLAHKLNRSIVVRSLPHETKIENLPASQSQIIVWTPILPSIDVDPLPEGCIRISIEEQPLALVKGSSVVILDRTLLDAARIGRLVARLEELITFEETVLPPLTQNLTTWLKRLRMRHIEDRE